MEGCLVTVNRHFIVVILNALISQNDHIGMRVQVEAVCVRPHHWLDDVREWHQRTLVQHCLSNFESIWDLALQTFGLLVLLNLKFFNTVPFDLLEVIISAESNLFAPETYSHRVCCHLYISDFLLTLSLEALKKEV